MFLLTILILIQTRGASLGAGLGGSAGEVNTVRRGTDKTYLASVNYYFSSCF
jgi:hypothetical protein